MRPPSQSTRLAVRNVAHKGRGDEVAGTLTPKYAHVSNFQNLGSQISLGVKGEF